MSLSQKAIGQRIEQARRAAKLSVRELAEIVIGPEGKPRHLQTVYKWEAGNIDPMASDWEQICRATGRPLAWFHGGDPETLLAAEIAEAVVEILFRVSRGEDLQAAMDEALAGYGGMPEAEGRLSERLLRRSADLRDQLRRHLGHDWDLLTESDRERVRAWVAERIEKRRSGETDSAARLIDPDERQ